MKIKYKLTRFARFVIFLALISPACYMAGLHFQNDLDLLDFADNFNIEWHSENSTDESEADLEDVEELREDIEDLREEIKDIENELNEKLGELKDLTLQEKEV